MVHCGYEATAVADTVNNPLKALRVLLRIKTNGKMAPEIPLTNQRPAEFVFDGLIKRMTENPQENETQLKLQVRSQTKSNAA